MFTVLYSGQDWWKVEKDGKQGFVPAAYVRKMPTPPASSPTTPTTPTVSMASSGVQDAVEMRQNVIKAKYTQLQQHAKERRQLLEDSKKRFNLLREIIELEHWINDKEALASAEEPSKDLDHVEMLMKKFKDFQKDIETNEARLEHIDDLAQEMIDAGHPDADEIQRLCEVCRDNMVALLPWQLIM